MINTVQPAKSGSKVHIFLVRNPRDNSPVTLCGRDIVTDPTISPNAARVGTSEDIHDNFCKTCVKHWESSAEYRAKVDDLMSSIAETNEILNDDNAMNAIADPECNWIYENLSSNLVRLLFTGRERHGMIKHQRDERRHLKKLARAS